MSVFGVILVRIFPHLDWIRTRIIPNTDFFHAVSLAEYNKKKAIGFKSHRVNYWEINQVASKCQMDFLNKTYKKASATKKVNITIEFYIFKTVKVPNFNLNWQFWIWTKLIQKEFTSNLKKKTITIIIKFYIFQLTFEVKLYVIY